MAEAARLKGVSYHTVSRAVRRDKLPAQRLGRMALISAEDLRAWTPMRERAPRKYRRREPNPDATPALLDLASEERVELAERLSALFEVIHSAAADRPLEEFLSLLTDRMATALDFRRVAIWTFDADSDLAIRVAASGPALTEIPSEVARSAVPALVHAASAKEATLLDAADAFAADSLHKPRRGANVFVAPLRSGERTLGAIIGDQMGSRLSLSTAQLSLAHGMANQAAIALDCARLRESETTWANQFEAILENVADAVFATDAAGRLTVINAAGRSLLGMEQLPLTPNEPLVNFIESVERRTIDGRPLSVNELPLVQAMRGEMIQHREHILIQPNGDERMLSVRAQPIRHASGRLAGAVAVVHDITEERAAAKRETERVAHLEAAAARAAAVGDVALAANSGSDLATVLRTAIAGMTDLLGGIHGSIFFREADGRLSGQVGYRSMGSRAEGLLIDPEEIPSTMLSFSRRSPLYNTYAGASPSEREIYDRFGFRAVIIAPLMTSDDIIGVAYVNYASDDRRPTAEEMNFAGALANQCAVAIEKARLMDRMESAHRRLLAVVDQLPQGVIIVEAPDGHLVLANRAAEELWGTQVPEDGSNALAFANAEGTPFSSEENPLNVTMTTGQGRTGETLMVNRPDGTRISVLATHAPVLDANGRIMGAVSVLQNIAQLRALDRAKDEFLSVAAHELRNPLTSLHGNLQLLLRRVQKDPDRAEDATRLEAIISQSDRLAQLVGRLLDVSRAELGRLDLEVDNADAAAIVSRAVDGARGLSASHQVVARTPESLLVAWDAIRIEQVLNNLVSNAVKYTEGGEVLMTLEESPGEMVQIFVRDHGAGIRDSLKSNLFERYMRANGEAQSEGDGLGLGLYISRLIARAHGGDLTVHDAPGGGALFVLTIPRRAVAANRAVRLEPTASA